MANITHPHASWILLSEQPTDREQIVFLWEEKPIGEGLRKGQVLHLIYQEN